MPDARTSNAFAANSGAAAEYLARQVALLCARLAEMLSATPVSLEDPVPAGIEFLRTLAQMANGDQALSGRVAAGEREREQPIGRIASAYNLAPAEIDLLVLVGMPEEHEGLASLFRTLHPRGEPRPTAGLAAQLLCANAQERMVLRELMTTGAVVRSGALQLTGDAPFFERSLLLADALWPALAGMNVWPVGIQRIRTPNATSAFSDWLGTERVVHARQLLERGAPSLLLVVGDDSAMAMHRAVALAIDANVACETLSYDVAAPRDVIERLIPLHAAARGVVPIVAVPHASDNAISEPPMFGESPIPVILCARTSTVKLRGIRPVYTLYAERLSTVARARVWSESLPELAAIAPELSARYAIEPHAVLDVADDVHDRAVMNGRAVSIEDVAESVRAHADLALAAGVQLVHPTATWDQLILSADRTTQLREALDRIAHQRRVLDEWGFLNGRAGARGVRMLFAGPPGTGKTLAAEVLAHTLGVDLLVVDISRLVSKWIGETEKNLAEVFDSAERTQAVLLFDEADALFGKRTEVSDAHDRYANLETAYLLSRLERFDGLAILSTNLRNNIDTAFTRRLEFVVDFDEPSLEERTAIWRCHLPPDAPLAPDVRVAELAALYPIVGGLIRNASVAAGFTASAANSAITRTDLVRAIRREYEKSGRAFPGAPAGTFTS
jgi:ATP-dependent 26S proteasome regulatory subunit